MTIGIRLVWCVTPIACKECIKPRALRPPTPHLLVSSPLVEDKDAQSFLLVKPGVNLIFFLRKILVVGRVRSRYKILVTGWTVRRSNPGGGEIFRTCSDRLCGPRNLLYNGQRVFPGGKERPGRDAEPSPPSSAVVMKG